MNALVAIIKSIIKICMGKDKAVNGVLINTPMSVFVKGPSGNNDIK